MEIVDIVTCMCDFELQDWLKPRTAEQAQLLANLGHLLAHPLKLVSSVSSKMLENKHGAMKILAKLLWGGIGKSPA